MLKLELSVNVVDDAPNLELSSASNSLAKERLLVPVLLSFVPLLVLLLPVVINSSHTRRGGSVGGFALVSVFCLRRNESSSSASRSMSKSKEGTSKAGRLGSSLEKSLEEEDVEEEKEEKEERDEMLGVEAEASKATEAVGGAAGGAVAFGVNKVGAANVVPAV